jgi:23S rRNA pseudouridine1911/1915/1917 synthase
LLAIAKTEIAFKGLAEQLSDHSMHREYKALVTGIISEDDGKIDAPIARDRKRPTRNCVDLSGKEAVTYFHVEQRYKRSNVTLISCRLLTGRTHQIRVHMEYIKHPVVGDPLYGVGRAEVPAGDEQPGERPAGESLCPEKMPEEMGLHAFRLTLYRPFDGDRIEITAEAPAWAGDVASRIADNIRV